MMALIWRRLRPMTKVTGKLQITLPKRLADAYGIQVGDEVELVASGEAIAILPARAAKPFLSPEERLRHFDDATRRQRERTPQHAPSATEDRGWTRDSLYDRARPR